MKTMGKYQSTYPEGAVGRIVSYFDPNIEIEKINDIKYRIYFKNVFVGCVCLPTKENILGNTINNYDEIYKRYNSAIRASIL